MNRALMNPLELAPPAQARRSRAGASRTPQVVAPHGRGDDGCLGRRATSGDVVDRLASAADLDHAPRGRGRAAAARPARAPVRAVERDELRDARRHAGSRSPTPSPRRPRAPSMWGRCEPVRHDRGAGSRHPLVARPRARRRARRVLERPARRAVPRRRQQGLSSPGDFRVVEIPEADRGEPVVFDGHDRDGRDGRERGLRGRGAGRELLVRRVRSVPGRGAASSRRRTHAFDRRGRRRSSASTRSDSAATARGLRRDLRRHLPERASPSRTARSSSRSPTRTPINATPTTLVLDTRGPGRRAHHRPASGCLDPDDARARRRWTSREHRRHHRGRGSVGRDPDRARWPDSCRSSRRACCRSCRATSASSAAPSHRGPLAARRIAARVGAIPADPPTERRLRHPPSRRIPAAAACCSACCCSSPASRSSSWPSRSSAARSGSSSSQYTDVITRILGVVVIVLGLVFIGALRLRAAHRAPAGARQRRTHRRPAARPRARHRLDALHRPDARRDHLGVVEPRRPRPRRAPRASPTRSGSASRSSCSRSASAGRPARSRSCAATSAPSTSSAACC